jgi:hypothetical protein
MVWGMEHTRLWPAPKRAANYQAQADRLRRMGEGETVKKIRDELLTVARQYQELADELKPHK